MKNKFILALPLLAALATGCTTTDQRNATIGGVAGAVAGGVATGTVEGAVVGGAIGAGAGVLIGRVAENSRWCWYRNPWGYKYRALCR